MPLFTRRGSTFIAVVLCTAAARAQMPSSGAALTVGTNVAARTRTLQDLVDNYRSQLAISQPVAISIVPKNPLLVSVGRCSDGAGFEMSFESDFLDALDAQEIDAVVAHELGHVWIFTHHPFLQTEELANDVALRLVSRDLLERVYAKVWQRTGASGDLVYLAAK